MPEQHSSFLLALCSDISSGSNQGPICGAGDHTGVGGMQGKTLKPQSLQSILYNISKMFWFRKGGKRDMSGNNLEARRFQGNFSEFQILLYE